MRDEIMQMDAVECQERAQALQRRYTTLLESQSTIRLETAGCWWVGNGIVAGFNGAHSGSISLPLNTRQGHTASPRNWNRFIRDLNTRDALEKERQTVLARLAELGVTNA